MEVAPDSRELISEVIDQVESGHIRSRSITMGILTRGRIQGRAVGRSSVSPISKEPLMA
jgi:hypothetical protein